MSNDTELEYFHWCLITSFFLILILKKLKCECRWNVLFFGHKLDKTSRHFNSRNLDFKSKIWFHDQINLTFGSKAQLFLPFVVHKSNACYTNNYNLLNPRFSHQGHRVCWNKNSVFPLSKSKTLPQIWKVPFFNVMLKVVQWSPIVKHYY